METILLTSSKANANVNYAKNINFLLHLLNEINNTQSQTQYIFYESFTTPELKETTWSPSELKMTYSSKKTYNSNIFKNAQHADCQAKIWRCLLLSISCGYPFFSCETDIFTLNNYKMICNWFRMVKGGQLVAEHYEFPYQGHWFLAQ